MSISKYIHLISDLTISDTDIVYDRNFGLVTLGSDTYEAVANNYPGLATANSYPGTMST